MKEQIEAYKEFSRQKLGFEFNDIQLLVTALTHRSYVNEHKKSVSEHNERLEFLGDAVLELIASDFLYRNYDETEGVMTTWRSSMVRTESIADAGLALGYEPLIRLSKGEKHGKERARNVIIADCFEAVIGAIYLDQGYGAAEKFVNDNILVKIDNILENESWRDAKSHLQEIAQKTHGQTPVYKLLKEDGPDHDKLFTLGVYIDGELKGTGSGHSKQQAQVEAAAKALEQYQDKTE
ncbi:MAG: ribonuclease III [Candidatus Saccharimonadales bacterium]